MPVKAPGSAAARPRPSSTRTSGAPGAAPPSGTSARTSSGRSSRRGAPDALVVKSKVEGVVTERNVVQAPSPSRKDLYRIADLIDRLGQPPPSTRARIPLVRIGDGARRSISPRSRRNLPAGKVVFIYPYLDAETGPSGPAGVREPDGKLKPGMYATVSIESPWASSSSWTTHGPRLGARQVRVRGDRGGAVRAAPGEVGPRVEGLVVILGAEGGRKGGDERTFLIDSESRLKAPSCEVHRAAVTSTDGHPRRPNVISKVIDSAPEQVHRLRLHGGGGGGAIYCVRNVPLDAIPTLGHPGDRLLRWDRSPDIIETRSPTPS